MATEIMTPKFRVSYPHVFKAQLNKQSGKEEYTIQALFAKDADLSKLKEAAKAALAAKWGEDPKKWPKELRLPFRDQGEKEYEDEATGKIVLPNGYERGAIFITFKSKQRPGIVDERVQPIIDESQFYAGCYARATVRPYVYGGPGTSFTAGVAFGLQNIQKVGEGEPFSGRMKAEDAFAPIEGAGEMPAGGAPKSAADLFG